MIPVELKLKGLYSYQDVQQIDFSRLTASQLFGIFGSVGCGKSSILEAIMFVLFDRSDRLNQKDNRYYNMLNLQSDEMEIDFIFKVEAKSKSLYRCYFRAGRNRKHYDQVVLRDRNYYKDEEGNWLPIAIKDASELLGMNYDHFMQTVIIPQGKFREFVDQGASQRTQMLKELFNLNQYELSDKVKILSTRNQTLLTEVKARLAEVGGVSEEEISVAKQQVLVLEKELGEERGKENALDKRCQAQEALGKLFEDIGKTETQLDKLQEQKTNYAQREKKLSDYNRAYTFFKERLQLQQETGHEISDLSEKRKQILELITRQEAEKSSAWEDLKKKQNEYEQRETDILKCQDLEYVIKIREFKEAHQQASFQLITTQKEVKQLNYILETNKKQLIEDEQKLEAMDEKLRFRTTLQDIRHWHHQQNNFLQEEKKCLQQKQQYASQIQSLIKKKASLLQPFAWANGVGEIHVLKPLIKAQVLQSRENQVKVGEQIQELRVKEKLAYYADDLEEGKACPLCGSVSHPQIAHTESVKHELEEQQQKLKALQEEEAQVRKLADEVVQLESEFNSTNTLLQNAEIEIISVKEKLEQHQQVFQWKKFKDYGAEDIQEFIRKLESLSQQADHLRKTIQQQKKDFPHIEDKLKAGQDRLMEIRQQEHALKTSIDNHLALLRVYDYEKWKNFGLVELKENLQKGKDKVEEAEKFYKAAVNHFTACEKALHGTQSKAETEKERLEKLQQKAQTIASEIDALCQQKNFNDIHEIKALLNLKLDVENEQSAIQKYNTSVSSLQDQLKRLKHEAEGKVYDKEKHQSILQSLRQTKEAVQAHQEKVTIIREEVKRMEQRLQNSHQLQQKLEKLMIRENNLKEMTSLFKGSGFVRYVSSVYLDNLCRTANERFTKLTRNNLSLELNEEGEFIVRDFLNNGKTRLLKTLSGGQTFQAALCMALALAENIKTINQAEQSFFFLDEGFGSLDKESLRLVFDTLKSLRQEHRIVGIISHVEELQQEIDVFLKIENDKDRGSLISCSWE